MEYPIIDLITDAYINNGWTGLDIVRGTNKFPYPYSFTENEASGITYKVNSDGSVDVSGTASPVSYGWLVSRTSDIPQWVRDLAGETVHVSSGNTSNTPIGFGSMQLILYGNPTLVIQESTGTIPTDFSNYTEFSVVLYVQAGTTVNSTLYPHITVSNTLLPYEPYNTNPSNDFFHRLKLPLPHYFPHPVIDALQRAAAGTQTADDTEILRHYLTPLGIGGI